MAKLDLYCPEISATVQKLSGVSVSAFMRGEVGNPFIRCETVIEILEKFIIAVPDHVGSHISVADLDDATLLLFWGDPKHIGTGM